MPTVARRAKAGRGSPFWILSSGFWILLLAACDSDSPFVFFDDFNRPDGTPGPNWWTEEAGAPFISGNRLCSDDTRGAITPFSVEGKKAKVSFKFSAVASAGLQAFVLSDDDYDVENGTWAAGLAADGALFSLIIAQSEQGVFAVGPSVNVSPGIPYLLEAVFDAGSILVKLFQENGTLMDQIAFTPAPVVHANYFGLGIGRVADGHLTYADDFRIEVLE